jgi:hypothetical protein
MTNPANLGAITPARAPQIDNVSPQENLRANITQIYDRIVALNPTLRIQVAQFPGYFESIVERLFRIIPFSQFTSLDPELQNQIAQNPWGFARLFERIPLEQFIDINDPVLRNQIAQNPGAFASLFGRITLDEFIALDQVLPNRIAQNPWDFYHLFGRIRFDQFIDLPPALREQAFQNIFNGHFKVVNPLDTVVNNRQNTHLPSVHSTVAESALKLKARYPSVNPDEAHKEMIEFFKDDALAALNRAYALPFVEGRSHVSMQQILALVWTGINDKTCILGGSAEPEKDIEHRRKTLGRCLVDANNEYGHGSATCANGTFHAIVSALNGIHPDVHIAQLTPAIIAEIAKNIVLSRLLTKTPKERLAIQEEDSDAQKVFLNECQEIIRLEIGSGATEQELKENFDNLKYLLEK